MNREPSGGQWQNANACVALWARSSLRAGLFYLCLFAGGLVEANVRFAPEKDYGPFIYQDSTGKVVGLSMEVLNAIRPALKSPIEILPAQPLSEILEGVKRGDVDLVSSLRPTPERSQYLAFTQPYVKVPAVLVVRQNSHPPTLEDMEGQPVAVGKGYAVEAFVRQSYPKVQWRAVADDTAALRELQSGALAGVVADVASVGFTVRLQQLKGLQVAGAVGFEYPLSFAYRKELKDLGQQLENGLRNLDPNARQALVDRWLETPELQFEDSRRGLLRWTGLAICGVAIGWIVWRRKTS